MNDQALTIAGLTYAAAFYVTAQVQQSHDFRELLEDLKRYLADNIRS